jgi:hypothetical protein
MIWQLWILIPILMNCNLQSKLSSLENLIKIQRECLDTGYMHGMLNGLICAHSVVTGDEPKYLSKYKQPTQIRHKKVKKR